jgi:hypothetical protein
MKSRTRLAKLNADEALIAGIQKYLPNATFLVDGHQATASQVTATLQSRVNAYEAVIAAEATFHGTVQSSKATVESTDSYAAAIRQTMAAMYASQPAILAELSVSARKKPAPRTVEQKVVAAAKAKATRTARHTLGPVQKSGIQGALTGPVVVPVNGASNGASAPSPPAPATPVASNTAHS